MKSIIYTFIIVVFLMSGISGCKSDSDSPESDVETDLCAVMECTSGYYCNEGECIETPALASIPVQTVYQLSLCGDDICTSSEEDSGNCCQDCEDCGQGYYCPGSGTECIEGTPPLIVIFPILIVPFPTSGDKEIHDTATGPPSIYGNKIVFSDHVSAGESRIHIYDIVDEQLTILPHDYDSSYAEIWGGRLVFEDHSRTGQGDDIYYYNFAEGVAGFISPRDNDQRSPKIFNNAIVYKDEDYLRMYWIPGNYEKKLYRKDKTNGILTNFDIYSGYIAYIAGEYNTVYKIKVYDISTENTEEIYSTTSGVVTEVAVNNDYIAYTNGPDSDNLDIYIYNRTTKLTTKATDNLSEKESLSIYEDKVVWSDDRNSTSTGFNTNFDIYVYDISDGTETKEIFSDTSEEDPDIYENYIVYRKGASSGDIMLHKLQ